ncbi:MAG TPA: hypothetical protein PKE16_13510 [Hyphomicrobium sp.]|nr:hypothetical protein [Hyphomicrobium sp.]
MIDGTTIKIRNPKFSREDGSGIDCEIEVAPDEWIPFTAIPDDVMPYTADIFNRAKAMGPVAFVAPGPVVPASVTTYQAMAAMLRAGLLDQVKTLMASDAASPQAKLAWEKASAFERDSVFINSLGSALGLTSQQIDDLFIAAAKI